MKQKLLFCLLLCLGLFTQVWAQERTITGKVTDADTGEPIPGVSVFVKGTSTGTVTDASGAFSISVNQGATLVFQSVGLTSQEVVVGSEATIDLKMKIDTKQLGEVVVTAYGEQNKKELTGSIASVKAEAFKNQPVLGLDQALQGRATGVQITQNSGTPGSAIAVRVRGATSINGSNEPLYVVDGIPINTGSYSQIGVGNQQISSLNTINPSDIESLEVLKDAAASALYGSRASNGVVLITTKRGTAGKTKINVNYYTGVQETWKRYTPLTGSQFVDLLADGLVGRYGVGTGTTANPQGVANADGSVTTTSLFGSGTRTWLNKNHLAAWYWTQAPAYNPAISTFSVDGSGRAVVSRLGDPREVRDVNFFLDPSTSPSTNWQNEIFRSAPISSYDVSMQGGTDKMSYFVSGNYFNQQGIIKGSGFKRLSGLINLDFQASNKLKFGTKASFSRGANNRINNDNNIYGVLSAALLMAPDVPVYLANGSYGRDPSSSVDNPLAGAYEPTNESVDSRLLSSIWGQYEIMKGLTFRSTWSIDYFSNREQRFLPTTMLQGRSVNGQADINTAQEINWLNENVLNFQKRFGEVHNFSALVGTSFQESKYSSIAGQTTNFPGNDIRQLTAGSNKVITQSSATSYALVSFFGRVAYDYQGKYFINASLRSDGGSRFSKNSRYGYFPSVSAAWRVSEENFLQNSKVISDLKLRASYGITGNQPTNNFGYATTYGSGSFYQQQPGLFPNNLGPSTLTWEKTSQLDVGFDLGLFNRVNLTASYYIKNTSDLLFSINIPSTSGFTSIVVNNGKMQNKGIELGITANPLKPTSALQWTSSFNISFVQNKIVSFPDGVAAYPTGFSSWVAPGESLGSFRGYQVAGIIQTQEELNALNTGSPTGTYISTLTRPGDIKFVDLNGDGRITSDDQKVLGNGMPKFYGGWTNTLTYKGFDLNILFQYQSGNKLLNYTRNFSEGMNSNFGQTDGTLARWTPQNTNTDVPRAVFGDPSNNRRASDRFIEDGSYIRLKNVALGYTIPASVIKKLKMNSIRVYVSSQNLLTFTKYKGLDPEVNTFSGSNIAAGTDFLTFPQARTYTFGVNLGF